MCGNLCYHSNQIALISTTQICFEILVHEEVCINWYRKIRGKQKQGAIRNPIRWVRGVWGTLKEQHMGTGVDGSPNIVPFGAA